MGLPYVATLETVGGDSQGAFDWSLDAGSLPDGLSLSSDGRISGTPSGDGSSFTVGVESSDGQYATGELSIEVTASCADLPGKTIVSFVDANLEAAVRAAAGLDASGDLDCAAVGLVTALDIVDPNGTHFEGWVETLQGVPHLNNLEELRIGYSFDSWPRGNEASMDLSGLEGLVALEQLVVITDNHTAEDLARVASLDRLRSLAVGYYAYRQRNSWGASAFGRLPALESLDVQGLLGGLGDIDELGHLTELNVRYTCNRNLDFVDGQLGLVRLDVSYQSAPATGICLEDIDALAGLSELEWLNLEANTGVGELEALAELEKLSWVGAGSTCVQDLGPLIANPGFGPGDIVQVDNLLVPQWQFDTLEARGAWVQGYDTIAAASFQGRYCPG